MSCRDWPDFESGVYLFMPSEVYFVHINLSVSLILYPSGTFIPSSSWNSQHMKSKPSKEIQDAHQVTNHAGDGELFSQPGDSNTLWKCKGCLGIVRRFLNLLTMWLCFHWRQDKVLQHLQVPGWGWPVARQSYYMTFLQCLSPWLSSNTAVTGMT